MRYFGLSLRIVFVLLFGFGLTAETARAQQKTLVPPQAPRTASVPTGPAEAKVSPDTPVITMDGYCDPTSIIGTTDKNRCRTVITRADFDKLAEAAVAGPAAKNQFAAFYVQFCLFAREAEKQGIDKDPTFQRKLELARIQALGQMLVQDLEKKSTQFAPGDLEKFYRENPKDFEHASFLRIFIPMTKFKDQGRGPQQSVPESAPEMKRAADEIYSRARSGADFEALQKEALDTANLKESETVKYENMAREQLRQSHQVVFDLKPGEISTLFEEPEEGYYVYKMLSKEIAPFSSVKADAEKMLQKRRFDSWIKAITDSAQISMNEEFFGTNPLKRR